MKLEKLVGPALSAEAIGEVDAVLLSHDQHSDNLDHSGKAISCKQAKRVLTTEAGAKRLGGHAEGFAPWAVDRIDRQGRRIRSPSPRRPRVTARPASSRCRAMSSALCVVASNKPGSRPIYISGDTTWFDGVAEVAQAIQGGVVLPFAGAAQTRGPFHLTMDTNDTIETARAFPDAVIVPVHTDGWAHFRQSAGDLRATFDTLGFGTRLKTAGARRGDGD